jgi:hypothetical protein
MRLKNTILIFFVLLLFSCMPIPLKKEEPPVINFVPLQVVNGNHINIHTVIPLLEKDENFLENMDSTSLIEVQKMNLDDDAGKEVIVKLLDTHQHFYKYYFLDNRHDSLVYSASLLYCCEAAEDTIPPQIDLEHKIIWVNERIWGNCVEGYLTHGFRLKNGILDTVVTMNGNLFEGCFVPGSDLYTAQLFREQLTVSDSLITIKILFLYNKRLAEGSVFSNNIYSTRLTFTLEHDHLKRRYISTEHLDGVRVPPLWPSDVKVYVEKKSGKILQ